MRWLTQYRLSVAETHRLRITDVYSLHRIVYDLFEDVRQGKRDVSSGILFADKGTQQGIRTILILSDRLPMHPVVGELQSRKVPQSYLQADTYFFEVTVNPVRRESVSQKLLPVRGRDAVAKWFISKTPGWGFEVETSSLLIKNLSVQSFAKDAARVTIAMATIVGVLRVTDRQIFVQAFCSGLGRAKTFGCGLLQITPMLS